ncbi:hypothetical protein [Aestuariirhabdus litorea]|uniref:Uncharacterized protein n=1 Tax=Aestuariirhabdus litorea TaxID=2528527 RepID=A0A3P3VND7_9GAMM|nr:hypothetical protein [Aestuariirhabdus litorea]RRJ83857.1 hypothetical protein D0544_01695 [Aestuariirhabdus litorea]RWW97080.1 hypothetical protein DZC74_01695 [Endozoicomonadaceae bacterium GTF-13]
MTLSLHNHNIVRVTDGRQVHNCTVIKMCFDYAVVKYQGELYRIPYQRMDEVVGHELLMPNPTT